MKKILSVLLVVMMLVGCIAPSLTVTAGDLAAISVPAEDTGLQGDTEYTATVSLTDTPADLIYLQMVVYWSAEAGANFEDAIYDTDLFSANSGLTVGPALGNARAVKSYAADFGVNTADYYVAVVDIEGNDVFGTGKLCDLVFSFDEAMEAGATFEYGIGLYCAIDGDDNDVDFDPDPIDCVITFEADPYIGLYEDPTLFIVPGEMTVEPGEEFTVAVRVDANPGIWGGLFALVYPSDLTLVSEQNGKVFTDVHYTPGDYNVPVAEKMGYLKDLLASFPDTETEGAQFITAYYDSDDTYDVAASNGVLAYFTFKLSEEAAPASVADLSIIYDTEGGWLRVEEGPDGDVYLNPVFDVVNAKVTVAGEPAGCDHASTHEEIIAEPTCTMAGTKNIVCDICNEIVEENVVIDALGHSFTAELTEPTCENAGYTTYTCKVCEYSYKDNYTMMLGHDYHAVVTEPTCTEAGYATLTCSRCGDWYVEEGAEALGHNYRAVVVQPTCTEDGYATLTCTRCGDSYVEPGEKAYGHHYIADKTPATCLEGGFTVFTCEKCHDTYTGDYTEALGHDYIEEVTKPTCTEGGYTTYTCSRCEDSFIDDFTEALGHDWDVGEVTVYPTEEAAGEKIYHCQRCDATKIEVLEPLDHVHHYELSETIPATCTEGGYSIYKCKCGESSIRDVVPALGHTSEVIEAVPATCMEPGFTEGSKCSVCGIILVQPVETEPTGHTRVDIIGVEPTCTESGVTSSAYCVVCNMVLVEAVEIPATGHTEATVEGKDPTCTEDGYTECIYCSVCDEVLVEAVEIPATGHTELYVEGKPATCTEDGYTASVVCSVCNEILQPAMTEFALGHNEVTVEGKDPTCTEDGYGESVVCSVCGEILVPAFTIPALGHAYEVVVTEPTCTEGGYTTYTCEICGDTYTADETQPLGHNYILDDHVLPTCTEDGKEVEVCMICNDVKTTVIKALGHISEAYPEVAATCTEDGQTGGSYCNVCFEELEAATVVPATGHIAGEWVIVTPATDGAAGLKQLYCTVCSALIDEQEIPALTFITKVSAKEKIASITLEGDEINIVSKANADYVKFAIGRQVGMKAAIEGGQFVSGGADFSIFTIQYPDTEAYITLTDKAGNEKVYTVTVEYDNVFCKYISEASGTESVQLAEDTFIGVFAKENVKAACFYMVLPAGCTYEADEALTVVEQSGKVYFKAFCGENNSYEITVTAPNGATKTYTVDYIFGNEIEILGVSGGYMLNNGRGDIEFYDSEDYVDIAADPKYSYVTFRFQLPQSGTVITCNDDDATTVPGGQYTYVRIEQNAEGYVETSVTLTNAALGAERTITIGVYFDF